MPPVKSNNGLKVHLAMKFNDYLKKLSCMNGNIAKVFNMDWLNTNVNVNSIVIFRNFWICSKYMYRNTQKACLYYH